MLTVTNFKAPLLPQEPNISDSEHIFSLVFNFWQQKYSRHELMQLAKEIMQTAGPGIISNCIGYGNSFCGSIFVCWLGMEFVATTGYANRFRYMFMVIPSYFFFALTNPLEKAFKSNEESPGLILTTALLLSIPINIISIALLSQVENMLLVIGENSEDAQLVGQYCDYLIISVPAYIALQIISQILFVYRPSLLMPAALFRTAIEIGLTYTMVLKSNIGFIGWPLASAIQNWTTLLISVIMIASPIGKELRQKIGFQCFSWENIKNISLLQLQAGSPIVLHFFTLALGGFVLTLFAGKLSQQSLAAFSIASSIAYWALMFLEPITIALSKLISSHDKNNLDMAIRKSYAIKAYGVSATIGFLINLPLSLMMIFGYRQLASFFLNASDYQQVETLLSKLLPIYSTFGLICPFKNSAIGIMRGKGNGKTLPGFLVELAAYLVIGITGGAIFTFSSEKTVIGIGASDVFSTLFAATLLTLVVQREISKHQYPETALGNHRAAWFQSLRKLPKNPIQTTEERKLDMVVANQSQV